jgi:ribosomal protein S18 acetylase RimI-like enzyme
MIGLADVHDIPQLMKLVNAAYRGDQSRIGWTTEADLISGEFRTDEGTLKKMLQNPLAVMLKFVLNEKLVGCVYLEQQSRDLYLGMLSVWPELQGQKIGKKLLVASEEFGRKNNMENIVMNVISRRVELINWYNKHGYVITSETKPFPADNEFGTPNVILEFVVLKKKLERQ